MPLDKRDNTERVKLNILHALHELEPFDRAELLRSLKYHFCDDCGKEPPEGPHSCKCWDTDQ